MLGKYDCCALFRPTQALRYHGSALGGYTVVKLIKSRKVGIISTVTASHTQSKCFLPKHMGVQFVKGLRKHPRQHPLGANF